VTTTSAVKPPALGGAIPGWAVAADLTPPELINARQLTSLRKLMAIGIVALLVVCAGGFYLAAEENSSASTDLASVQDRTAELRGIAQGYSDVVSIQGSISQVQTQIAQVMGGDVDLVALIGDLQNSLKDGMSINQIAIVISVSGVAGANSAPAASGLDTSGLPRIGTITMSGTGQTLDDAADYVDRLQAVTGIVDVLPIANNSFASGSAGTQFNLTMGLTNALLTHRFDVGAG